MLSFALLLSMLFLTSCQTVRFTPVVVERYEVEYYINKFLEQREKRFSIERPDSVISVTRISDENDRAIFLHIKTVDTLGVREEVFQNGRVFDLSNMRYRIDDDSPHHWYSVAFLSMLYLPSSIFFDTGTAIAERISTTRYRVTVTANPSHLPPWMDNVFVYTLTVRDGFLYRSYFGNSVLTIFQDIGDIITIDESEFTSWN